MNLPAQDSRVWWIVGIVVTGIYGMQGINLTISYNAMELAYQAAKTADTARPNPWTSLNHHRYADMHVEQHMNEIATAREYVIAADKNVQNYVLLAMSKMEIPPRHVVESIHALEKAVIALDKALVIQNAHLTALETRYNAEDHAGH